MHNTIAQNEAFRKAFDATNARYKAAMVNDNAIKEHLASIGITAYTMRDGNCCTMISYGRVVAYYYVKCGVVTDIVYD